MHRISWPFLPRLCVSVFLSTPLQLSLPCFPALFFPLSFLLSHLVTRPLERSVEFPVSQRRGQSEPHKDPQWTPSALSSLQLHTHTYRWNYKRIHTPCSCYFFFPVFLLFRFLGVMLSLIFSPAFLFNSCFSCICLLMHFCVLTYI